MLNTALRSENCKVILLSGFAVRLIILKKHSVVISPLKHRLQCLVESYALQFKRHFKEENHGRI